MARAKAPQCPNCRANLPVVADATSVRCDYCGTESLIKHTFFGRMRAPKIKPKTPAAPHRGAPQVAAPHKKRPPSQPARGVKVGKAVWVVPFLMMVGVGGFTAFMNREAAEDAVLRAANAIEKATRTATSGSSSSSSASRKSQASVAEEWSRTASPTLVDVDGDGTEDMVGIVQRKGDSATETSLVVAISGSSFAPLWKSAELAGDDARFVVLGKSVIASHGTSISVFSLENGSAQGTYPTSDKVDKLCPVPETEEKVWVAVSDREHLLLDLAASKTTVSKKRPKYCPRRRSRTTCTWQNNHRYGQATARCTTRRIAPKVSKYRSEYVLSNGDDNVSVGRKNPGTRIPMAVGYVGKKVVWKRSIPDPYTDKAGTGAPSYSDLAGGRLVATYKLDGKHRIIAISAHTGATQWDVPYPLEDRLQHIDPSYLKLTESRLYLLAWGTLYVMDASTGGVLKSFGR